MKTKGPVLVGKPQEILTEKHLQDVYNVTAKVISHTLENTKVIKQIIPLGIAIEQ